MAFDVNRLYAQLNITGLQQKEPALYQVILQLIRALSDTIISVGAISGSVTNNITTDGNTIINQILFGSDDGGDGGLVIPGERGPAGTNGTTGAQGAIGPVVFIEDGIDGLDGQNIPQPGAQGIQGNTGPTGPPVFLVADPYIPDELIIPGPKGDTGSGSNSGLVFLGVQTTAGAASLDFTSLISSTYNKYIFEFENILPVTDNVELWMRTSTNNGSSYDAGGSDYAYADYVNNTGAFSTNGVSSAGASAVVVMPSIDNGSTTGGINGHLELFNPLNATQYKSVGYQVNGWLNDGQFYNCVGSGWRVATADIDAVRFMMSSGNIIGTIRMYGVAKV